MEILPQIKVSFFFSGDEFDIDEVTEKLKINPTTTRKKEDFPIKQLAHTLWSLDTEKESCNTVSIQFEKLMELLRGKETLIKLICSNYKINAEFIVDIWMNNGDKPEMFITKDIFSFIASIKAAKGFDLFIY